MWAWALTPIGRRVILGVGIAAVVTALLLDVYLHGRHAGMEKGRQEGEQKALDQTRAEATQDRTVFLQQMQMFKDRDAAGQQLIGQALQAVQQANAKLAQVQADRLRDQQRVSQLSDDQLFADLIKKLGFRQAGAPPFTAPELRAIDQVVTDYPHSKEEAAELRGKVADLQKAIAGLNARVGAIAGERDTAVAYGGQMEILYARAYNAAQRPPNWFVRAITFGQYKGKHIDLPKPEALKKP